MSDRSQFRIIPASGTYPGITALSIGDRKELVCLGTGKKVEKALLKAKEGRG